MEQVANTYLINHTIYRRECDKLQITATCFNNNTNFLLEQTSNLLIVLLSVSLKQRMMTDEETLLGVVFIVIIFCILINFFSVNMLMNSARSWLTFPFPPQSVLKYLKKLKIEQDTALENRGTLFALR